MFQGFSEILSSAVIQRVILTLIVFVLALILRRLLYGVITRRLNKDSGNHFAVRKVTTYVVNVIAGLLIFGIWAQNIVGEISVTLGVLGAGLAFALQEVISSVAGWVAIVTIQPYGIGDRIEINAIQGDVVDINLMFTKLMEIRNWLSYDQYTGRTVNVPNSLVLTSPFFNYSRPFSFVWDEITVPVTYDADWKRATEIIADAVKRNPHYQQLLALAESQLRRARGEIAIQTVTLAPQVLVRLTDNWIELALIYPVDARQRPIMRGDLNMAILTEFASAGITIASKTMEIVRMPQRAN